MKYRKVPSQSWFQLRKIVGRKVFADYISELWVKYENRAYIHKKANPIKSMRAEWKIVFRKNYVKWGGNEDV